MKAIIAGGTGFIGRPLAASLVEAGWEVVILSRRREATAPPGCRLVTWPARVTVDADGADESDDAPRRDWRTELAGAEAVINLAGEPIAGGRWNRTRKQQILASRVRATRALVDAAKRCASPEERPKVWINGSAVGYYGRRGDEIITEEAAPGTDFLARVCRAWEDAALEVVGLGIRTIRLRIGIVLADDGGALPRLLVPFRLFAGGPLGSGRQWWPWIHRDDLIGLIHFLLDHPRASGPVNAVSPQPLPNRTFARVLGEVLRRPSWCPAPAPLLRLALGEMAEAMLLSGQRSVPAAATRWGYAFTYPELEPALRAILRPSAQGAPPHRTSN